MKKQVFQAATLLVAIMALFTGCDKAENVIEDPTGGLVQVVAKAATGYPDTRIGYSESGNKMTYIWGDLDTERFSVFYGPYLNTKYDFWLKGGARSNKGRFEGQLPQPSGITYATYPALNNDPVNATAISHDLSNQGLYTSTDALYGNSKHLMWATAEANNGEVDYQFAHKISMFKLELTFTGVTSKIKRVSIYGAHNKANLNATNGVLSYEDAGKGVIAASDAAGFDLVDNVLTAYVYLFPEDLSGTRLSITATDATGKEYTSGAFDGRILNAGTIYRLRRSVTEMDHIVVGTLKWAKGNLIADGENGAKIGTPEDGGLFFKFGSLVGWSGGGNDDGTGRDHGNSLSLQIKPVRCPITTWNSTWTGDPASDLSEVGIGDPCRYYLGAPWRLPTKEEFNALFGQEPTFTGSLSWGSATTAAGWSKEGDFVVRSTDSYVSHTSGLKFPVSGFRSSSGGDLSYPGRFGFLRSASSIDEYKGFSLYFSFPEVYPSWEDSQSFGYPVRCVRD